MLEWLGLPPRRLAEFLRRFLLPEIGRDVAKEAAAAAPAAAGGDVEDDDDRWNVQESLLFLLLWKVGEAAAAAAEEPDRPEDDFTGLYIVSVCALYQGKIILNWIGS